MLQKQNIPIMMTQGLNTGEDSGIVAIQGKVTGLVDAEFDTASTIVTRAGTSRFVLPGTFTGNVQRLFTNQANALGIEDSNGKFWASKGSGSAYQCPNLTSPRMSAQTQRISGIKRKVPIDPVTGLGTPVRHDLNFDQDTAPSGTVMLAFEEYDTALAQMVVKWSVRDQVTSVVASEGTLSGAGQNYSKPRVVYCPRSDKFFLFVASWAAAATQYNVFWYSIPAAGGSLVLSSGLTTTAGVAVESTIASEVVFDVSVFVAGSSDSRVCVAARETTAANGYRSCQVDHTGAKVLADTVTAPAVAASPVLTAHIKFSGGVYTSHYFYVVGTATVKGRYIPSSTNTPSAENAPAGLFAYYNIVVIDNATAGIDIYSDFDYSGTTAAVWARTTITDVHVYSSGGLVTGSYGIANAVMASRVITIGGFRYIAGRHIGFNYNNVMFLVNVSNFDTTADYRMGISARVAFQEAFDPIGNINFQVHSHRTPNAVSLTGSQYGFSYIKYDTDLLLAGTTNDTGLCIEMCKLDPNSQLGFIEVNGATLLAGACPLWFDGHDTTEENFNHQPDLAGFVDVAGGGRPGPFALGSASFCTTFGYTDNLGNWIESAPSNIITVTFAGANTYLNFTCPLPPTTKQNARVLLYRTKVNSADTTFYLCSTANATFVTNDTTLGGGQPLPTTGGNLPVAPMPACRQICRYYDRLFISGCEDGQTVYWSKSVNKGYGSEFVGGNTSFQLRVYSSFGRIVGCGEVFGKLAILGEYKIGTIYGQGPDDFGQGLFSPIEVVIPDVGCAWNSPNSIRHARDGMWFYSTRGQPRMMTSSGELGRDPQTGNEIGSECLEVVGVPTSITVQGEVRQQVRFYNQTQCYVWDSAYKQWSQFTNHQAHNAVHSNIGVGGGGADLFSYTSTAVVRGDNVNTASDISPTTGASLGLFSSSVQVFLMLAQFAGIQRIYEVYGRLIDVDGGVAGSDIALTVRLSDTSQGLDSVRSNATFGFTYALMSFRHQPSFQRCSEAQLTVTMKLNTDLGVPQRIRLTGLGISAGLSPKTFKSSNSV